MGEQGSRELMAGFCTISESLCSASSKRAECGGRGSEREGGRRARNDENTRLAIDADSGTTPRQPWAPRSRVSVHNH